VTGSAANGGQIVYNDRVLVLGDTGAGKSEFINFGWSLFQCQRLLLDTKDEFSVPDLTAEPDRDGKHPNIKPVRNVEDIDWSAPVIHYIPSEMGSAGVKEMDDLFRAAFHSPHALIVFVHEISDVCQYSTIKTPPHFDRYVAQGRVHAKGLWSGSQLPVDIPKRSKTLAQHIVVLVPAFDRPQDSKAIAEMIAMREQDADRLLREMHETLGDYSFVHYVKGPTPTTCNRPLSEDARRRITITRRADA
jgi:hypothetical protein